MNLKNADLTSDGQKAIAALIGIALLGLAYFLLPPLVFILKNLLWTIALGTACAIIIYMYPIFWMLLKQASWEATKKVISSNKLWYMWQGHKYLVSKNEELNKSIQVIGGIKFKTEKELARLAQEAENAKTEAIHLEAKGVPAVKLKVTQSRVALLTKQFDTLNPRLDYIKLQHEQLIELHNNWVADAEILGETLQAKEEEYKLLKEMSSASDSAMAFLKDTPEMVHFKESLKQIDESINQYTAKVENFQRNVMPTLQKMETRREMDEEKGRQLIEKFKAERLQIAA